ncbi:hypothetical protein [Aliiroseovarius sp. 2305UL8-7]|uniref:hypothetical protein n=1 Tax=Aliiroseovarius conchicola TaxID=3121637 RepID=UPI003528490A
MTHDPCTAPKHGDAALLETAGLDADERAVLHVMRYFFQSFTRSSTQGWMGTFRHALDQFPADQAANVALAVLSVVQNMRISRREVFRFSNPDCPGCCKVLCDDERQLIGIVVAMRRGQISRAHTHALLICEGNDTAPVLQATRELSHILAHCSNISGHAIPKGSEQAGLSEGM